MCLNAVVGCLCVFVSCVIIVFLFVCVSALCCYLLCLVVLFCVFYFVRFSYKLLGAVV